ncbi:MAG TPA: hypothetical protein VK981_04445 [Ramlibacter sp.]|nr:hypothetical protein [Ramlibacter sp.]
MRTAVIAFVLCLAAVNAGAQCANVPTSPLAAAQTPPAARPSGELIKTAGAVTHEGAPSMQAGPPRGRAAKEEERPQHTGTAMLLAALALMSGIALRRYGAKDE